MWRRPSERERALVLLLVVAGLLTLFFFYVLQPQFNARRALRYEITRVEGKLAAAERMLETALVQEKALKEAQAELQQLGGGFTDAMGPGTLMVGLGRLAREGDVKITYFRPLPVVETPHLREWPVEIGVRGTYPEVLAYLKQLGDLPNFPEIRRLELRGEKGAALGRVEAELLLIVYADSSTASPVPPSPTGSRATGRDNAFRATAAESSGEPVLLP